MRIGEWRLLFFRVFFLSFSFRGPQRSSVIAALITPSPGSELARHREYQPRASGACRSRNMNEAESECVQRLLLCARAVSGSRDLAVEALNRALVLGRCRGRTPTTPRSCTLPLSQRESYYPPRQLKNTCVALALSLSSLAVILRWAVDLTTKELQSAVTLRLKPS